MGKIKDLGIDPDDEIVVIFPMGDFGYSPNDHGEIRGQWKLLAAFIRAAQEGEVVVKYTQKRMINEHLDLTDGG